MSHPLFSTTSECVPLHIAWKNTKELYKGEEEENEICGWAAVVATGNPHCTISSQFHFSACCSQKRHFQTCCYWEEGRSVLPFVLTITLIYFIHLQPHGASWFTSQHRPRAQCPNSPHKVSWMFIEGLTLATFAECDCVISLSFWPSAPSSKHFLEALLWSSGIEGYVTERVLLN